jgi:hypothetical protein
MSDEPTPAPQGGNRTVTYLLVAVVALLAIFIGIVMFRNQPGATGTAATGAGTPGASTTGTAPAGAMPGVQSSTGAPFDPATATKVPAGETPEAYMGRYYQAIIDKKFDVAFKMQPAASQANGTAESFGQTQTGYGYTAFKVVGANTQGNTSTVSVDLTLGANGNWGVDWVFVKSGDNWLVKERSKIAMK